MKSLLPTLAVSALAIGQSSGAIQWQVGIDNNAQFHVPGPNAGTGGGLQANFIQELADAIGNAPLPGVPNNAGGPASGAGRSVDDDYYFAGVYSTVLDGSGYTPVGAVGANEENVERAFTGADPELRFHFNLDPSITATDRLSISFDFYNMDLNGQPASDPSLFWDVEVLYNSFSVTTFRVTDADIRNVLNPGVMELTTPTFNLGDFNSSNAPGADNYVTLRGTNVGSNSRWMSLDYVALDASPVPEPSSALFVGLGALGALLVLRRRSR